MKRDGKEPIFLDYFEDLKDPRIERKKLYPMNELLFTTLCAVICGCEGWSDVELFGKSEDKQQLLKQYFPYTNGAASDDTYRRFFRSLDTETFGRCFRSWVDAMLGQGKAYQICVDGKTHRGSHENGEGALHMINAFACEARLVLAQTGREGKGHELSGIKEVLGWLDLRGAIVTIDALGCQREVARQILNGGGEYLLALKENQPTLYKDVVDAFVDEERKVDVFEDVDVGHGRVEKRHCEVIEDIELLQLSHNWPGLAGIVKVSCERDMGENKSIFSRYYVSSVIKSAEEMLSHVRSHWQIENGVHWILDMSFGEDASRIRKENAPQNVGVLRHMALNMIKAIKGKRESIKQLRKKAGWENVTLERILNGHL